MTYQSARLDVAALGEQLLGRWAEQRRMARELMRDVRLQRVYGEDVQQHRARVLTALQVIADSGTPKLPLPSSLGGSADHGGVVARFEEMALGDPSIGIKGGVQWGLFGSAILHLGTAVHHERWLTDIAEFRIPGIYAMTETGHGSDVASLATTATYDPATEEFVIHTPHRAAWKDYLGNAGQHGIAAVVFAQLVTGGESHGVHAFYVPIRDPQTMAFLPGIGGEDDGVKGGLNGVDNGRLHFDQVRIPRDHLLDRYGSVAPDGAYSSPIASKGRRFFTMLGTLVQGRVSLDGSAVAATKVGLTTAIKYGSVRRQFAAADGLPETVLLDYGRHQRRLLPRLAQTYAMVFAHEELLSDFHEIFSGRTDTDANRQELETRAAALKALSSWGALDILQESREACGGQGFLAVNKIAPLRADLDIWTTFEGDNNVLLQLVGKRLLTDFGRQLKAPGAMRRLVVRTAAGRLGLRRLTGKGGLTEAEQEALLTDRVATMVQRVAGRLDAARTLPAAEAADIFNRHQNELILAAKAQAELLQWQAFSRGVAAVRDPGTQAIVAMLRDLFGYRLIEQDAGWFLTNRRLSPARAASITEAIDEALLPTIREHAVDLVDAFLIPDALLPGIATGDEEARQAQASSAPVGASS